MKNNKNFNYEPKNIEELQEMEELKIKSDSAEFIRRLVIICVAAIIAMPILSILAEAIGIDATVIIDKVIMIIGGITTTSLGVVIGKNLDKKE